MIHLSLPFLGSLEALEGICQLALRNCSHRPYPILLPGIHRGGEQQVGGITWADWEFDFEDNIRLPQIVGHMAVCGPDRKGRSYCLDGNQSCYGLLDDVGNLAIKKLNNGYRKNHPRRHGRGPLRLRRRF